MTRRQAIALSVLFALAITAAVLRFRALPRAPLAEPAGLVVGAGNPSLAADSVYLLDSTWTTDTGRTLRLSELRGHYRIVALIFTSCPRACPTLVKELKALERRMTPRQLDAAKFVLVSIDPERDTVPVLREYRARMGLTDRWMLLRGSAEAVRMLAATLGYGYGKDDSQQLVHSRLVTLLDTSGRILRQASELATDPQSLLVAIEGATSTAARF